MAVHTELKKKLDNLPTPVAWVDNAANATIAAANNTFDAKTLHDLERTASVNGFMMTTVAGALVFVPK